MYSLTFDTKIFNARRFYFWDNAAFSRGLSPSLPSIYLCITHVSILLSISIHLFIYIPLKILRLEVVGSPPPSPLCFFLSLYVLLDTLASTASGIRKTADWRTEIPTRTVNVKQGTLRKYKIIASGTTLYAYTHTHIHNTAEQTLINVHTETYEPENIQKQTTENWPPLIYRNKKQK